MFIVEWCYGPGSPVRTKMCDSPVLVSFWHGFAVSSGATMIAVREVGTC